MIYQASGEFRLAEQRTSRNTVTAFASQGLVRIPTFYVISTFEAFVDLYPCAPDLGTDILQSVSDEYNGPLICNTGCDSFVPNDGS